MQTSDASAEHHLSSVQLRLELVILTWIRQWDAWKQIFLYAASDQEYLVFHQASRSLKDYPALDEDHRDV